MSILIGLEGLALGGCPINALDLGRELRRSGHRVHVFAVDEQVRTSLLPYAEQSGFRPTLLPTHASTTRRARQIRRLVLDHSADIVHVFGPWMAQAASIAVAGSVPRSAVVTNWMMENVDYVPRRTPLILGTRKLQLEAEKIQEHGVWLMEPPVDLEADVPDRTAGRRFRSEVGIADDEVAAVVVTRVDHHLKEESLRYTVQAIARLDRPELRLVVVGDGDAFDRIAIEAARTNDQLGRPAVVLTGARHDPRPAYDAADFVLAMGGSALRALAHAKPLIVLGKHGFARTFEPSSRAYFAEHGFYGDVAFPDPVEHLGGRIADVLDPARRLALAEFGRTEIQHFGLQSSAARLNQIYHQALAEVPGTGRRLVDAGYLMARAVGHEAHTAVRRRSGARPAGQS